MIKRKITNIYDVEFTPFDNYGVVVPGMSWHKISYNKEDGGQGTYVLKMEPGSKVIKSPFLKTLLSGSINSPSNIKNSSNPPCV